MKNEEKLKKFIITNHTELRKRHSIDASSPKKTDQSGKNMSDINNIMDQYMKTGLLPVTQTKVAQYIDNTEIMSLEQAHDQIQHAKELFYELPATIRKLMDNDPTKLHSFITDKENYDILVKYKMIEPKVKKVEETTSQNSPSVDNVKDKNIIRDKAE